MNEKQDNTALSSVAERPSKGCTRETNVVPRTKYTLSIQPYRTSSTLLLLKLKETRKEEYRFASYRIRLNT
jgi:hypothetical protein